jgi:pyruvate/2-oxoacid:ferredoxin oxidoreductase alpha subunit
VTIKVLDGNKAAAYAVLLAKPDVIAVYPITPQTPLAEQLAKFHANGQLTADMVEVEGENSAIGTVTGSAVAGGRVFTATSSWGLAFMNDGLMFAAGMRVPVVMVNVTREAPLMRGVLSSRQDIMSIRDTGWVQIEVETCQEILDTILMAYKLAEDSEILLPVVVTYDGFYLSHLAERVEIPEQEVVTEFYKSANTERTVIGGEGEPLHFSITPTDGRVVAEYRYKHCQALEKVKQKLPEIEQEFKELFGRSYGGLIDTYMADDAEIVLLTSGSCAGTIRVVVDEAREKGIKVGLVKLRVFRPFPHEALTEILKNKRAVGVIDRSVCLGWNCGHLFMELRTIKHQLPQTAIIDFIDGLASLDITKEHIRHAMAVTQEAAEGKAIPEISWLTFAE